MQLKIDKGPMEMIKALASGDPQQIAEAKEFQRESFRAKFGCYPEELTHDCDDDQCDYAHMHSKNQ